MTNKQLRRRWAPRANVAVQLALDHAARCVDDVHNIHSRCSGQLLSGRAPRHSEYGFPPGSAAPVWFPIGAAKFNLALDLLVERFDIEPFPDFSAK